LRDGADAQEPLDRERMEKRELAVGRHEQQAVGLRDAACDLARNLSARRRP
jgi:hypothetical protein